MDITGNHAPFDTFASQRATAYPIGQGSYLEELLVENPYPQQPESDWCAENAHVQPTVPSNDIQSKCRKEPTENLGIKLRDELHISLPAKDSTIPSAQCNETTNGKPVCMQKVPPLALWLGELPIGLCDKDGPMMKRLEMLSLKEWPPDILAEFVLEMKQTLELIRKERNRQAHELPKTWQVGTEEWDRGIKDLQRHGYVSSTVSDKLTKFYNLLKKSKFHIS